MTFNSYALDSVFLVLQSTPNVISSSDKLMKMAKTFRLHFGLNMDYRGNLKGGHPPIDGDWKGGAAPSPPMQSVR